MQIVIDIPDEKYDRLMYQDIISLRAYIENGIVLPKGHGRLIDADRVITEATEKMKYPSNYEYMECVIAHMNLAPTIIKADRSEDE